MRLGWTIAVLVTLFGLLSAANAAAATPVFRVNAGGPALAGSPGWEADSGLQTSPYANTALSGNTTYSTIAPIDVSDPSVPAGTPGELFQTERWDQAGPPELAYDFPVTPGRYQVRLYFAEIYGPNQQTGARVFDASIEGSLVLDNYDVFADAGANAGVVKTFDVTSDANLDVDLAHVVENPAIKGIEILPLPAGDGGLGASVSEVNFGDTVVGSPKARTVTLTNVNSAGGESIAVDGTSISGTGASSYRDGFDDSANVTLAPGESTAVETTFEPSSTGAKSASLAVAHSGSGSPLTVALRGNGVSTLPVGFGKSALAGETSYGPTSLQWGPDDRLYVAQFNGIITAYSVARTGANSYAVTQPEKIDSIKSISNHDDDGKLNSSVTDRLITGMTVAGTAANPVVYVSSSDPRIGAGTGGGDLNLDTNSSTVSRLTRTSTGWKRLELVRGLPRSEENHAANGLELSGDGKTLYLGQGGNTNKGAPSHNFANLPEYAYSAAVLSIDLAQIGETTYDLPTLDDETRAGTPDANDPFGGDDGRNQAKLTPSSPVRVHAPGFRNPYDVLLTKAGKLYTIDNGGNAGWGDVPEGEGPQGTCTNAVREPGTSDPDHLHLITGAGYYGGHANPTRGNLKNTFNPSKPQPAVSTANPIECDSRSPGAENGSLTTFPGSTNGMAEYTASNFGGAMKGDLLAAGYSFNNLYRLKLSGDGTSVTSNSSLVSNVGERPLDVDAVGDSGPFPGTVWIADESGGQIHVLEPTDYDTGGTTCLGTDDPTLDEDADGYDNADELDNGTSPCSAADKPADADNDLESDLNDPDDDNDNTPDVQDAFAIDAQNGTENNLPVRYTWENDAPSPGGLLGLGFTGLMTNGKANYRNQYDPAKLTAGGAAGVLTVDEASEGDAAGATNTQEQAFQLGVDASSASSGPFTVRTRIMAPFQGVTPQGNQSMGLFLGKGDQDNYLKIVTSATGVEVVKEVGGTLAKGAWSAVSLPGPDYVDLYLKVDPQSATVQPSYSVTANGSTGTRKSLGAPVAVPSAWLGTASMGMAVGVISTSSGTAPPFPATWDFLEVAPEAAEPPPSEKVVAEDAYSRSQSGGWGRADTGGSWAVLSGPATDLSVDGTKGTITTSGGSQQRVAHLPSTSARDIDARVEMTFPAKPQSGGSFGYLVVRRQSDGGYYRVGLYLDSAGKVWLRGQNHTGNNLFSDVATGVAYEPGKAIVLRVQAEGASPTALRAKAWKTGTSEPSGWQVAASDASAGPQTAGSLGVRTVNTSPTPTTVSFDDLRATELGSGEPPPDPSSAGLWQARAPTGLNRQEVSYVEVGGKLYLAGGGTAQQVYDPAAGTWKNVAPLPQALDHIQAVALGGKIYYIGGLTNWPGPNVNTVYVYDPAKNSFTQGAPMPAGRGRGAGGVAVHNGKIYYAGGLSASVAVPWLDVYDPSTNGWQRLPDMPRARDHFHAAVVDGKLYAIGGRNKEVDATTTANDAYDIAANRWATGLASLPTARGGFAAAALADEIFVIGGEGGGKAFNTVEAYNTKTNSWRTLASMPTARHGLQAAVCNGGLYIAAGGKQQYGGSPADAHEVLFPGGAAKPCAATPPTFAAAQDSFSRSFTGGFGTADAGGPWSILAGPSTAFSVDGARGRIVTPGGGQQRLLHLGSSSERDVDAKAQLTYPNAAQGSSGGVLGYLVLRRQAAGSYYRVGLDVRPSGKVYLRAQNQADAHLFPDVDTGLTASAGATFALRVQVEGANPTKIRARAWKAGTPEPGTWQASATDSTVGPQSAGSIGLRTINTTSTAATIEFDDLLATRFSGGEGTVTAQFSASSRPTAKEPVALDASGSSSTEGSATYLWDFTGDGRMDAAGRRAEATFATAGRKRVTLDVISGSGTSDSVTRTIEVKDPPARLAAAAPQSLERVRRHGLAARCEARPSSRCTLSAVIPPRAAQKLGLRPADDERPYPFGPSIQGPLGRTVRILASDRVRRALRDPSRISVLVRALVTEPDARRVRLSRKVPLKR